MKICYFVVKDNELLEIDKAKVAKLATTAMTTVALTANQTVHAAPVTHEIDITTLTQPFIKVIVDLSNPFAYACAVKGALKLAAGEDAQGKKMIKNALSGYLVVKFIPQMFELLDGVNLF